MQTYSVPAATKRASGSDARESPRLPVGGAGLGVRAMPSARTRNPVLALMGQRAKFQASALTRRIQGSFGAALTSTTVTDSVPVTVTKLPSFFGQEEEARRSARFEERLGRGV